MARIRTIKPEFWTSEQVMELCPLARLAFVGLWNFCDDRGVHPASAKTLKAEVFPADDVTAAQVQGWIDEMVSVGLLSKFSANDRQWWSVTGWHHQLINRPSKSRYPEPPRNAPLPSAAGQGDSLTDATEMDTEGEQSHGALTEDSLSIHGALTEDSLTEGKGEEGNRNRNKTSGLRESSTEISARSAEAPPQLSPTSAGLVCRRLREAGVASVNPSHPKLLALLEAGMTGEEIADLAMEPASKGKPFGWLLAAAEGRRRDAGTVRPLPRGSQGAIAERNKAAAEMAKQMIFGQEAQRASG